MLLCEKNKEGAGYRLKRIKTESTLPIDFREVIENGNKCCSPETDGRMLVGDTVMEQREIISLLLSCGEKRPQLELKSRGLYSKKLR